MSLGHPAPACTQRYISWLPANVVTTKESNVNPFPFVSICLIRVLSVTIKTQSLSWSSSRCHDHFVLTVPWSRLCLRFRPRKQIGVVCNVSPTTLGDNTMIIIAIHHHHHLFCKQSKALSGTVIALKDIFCLRNRSHGSLSPIEISPLESLMSTPV